VESKVSGTFFVVEFYIVDPYGKSGRASVERNKQLRRRDSDEVLAGRTS
jgi:hypothetical protein